MAPGAIAQGHHVEVPGKAQRLAGPAPRQPGHQVATSLAEMLQLAVEARLAERRDQKLRAGLFIARRIERWKPQQRSGQGQRIVEHW